MILCKRCKGSGLEVDLRADGAALRKRRENAGLTQRAVALAAGYSAAYLCDLEHGRRRGASVAREAIDRAIVTLSGR